MYIKRYILGLVLSFLCFSVPVGADTITVIESPDPIYYSPVFITGFQMTSQLDFIEIYNESPNPVDLSTWSIQYQSSIPDVNCKIQLQDWLLSENHLVVATEGSVVDETGNVLFVDSCVRGSEINYSFMLYDGEILQETIKPVTNSTIISTSVPFVRKGLTKTYRSEIFASDFVLLSDKPRSLYADELYIPPEILQIQISEILINSRNCSPLEATLDCSDYVKLYNPTDSPIDLSYFRLRNGYLGQNPSTSNTTQLEGILESGHYIVISAVVTNSASWLWLEDFYGVKRYDNTVTEYPDGSSDTKKGQAYAYDISDGNWKWTNQPTPSDAPSIFPVPVAEPLITVASTTVKTETLVPCKDGQYRSEETNRCRNIEAASSVLVPCGEGQERNPETNRCRAISTVLGDSDLVPCGDGQERNPETNRCRNIVSSDIPPAEYAPEQVDAASNNYILWWSLGGVGSVAVIYAIWEWRRETANLFKKLKLFINRRKFKL